VKLTVHRKQQDDHEHLETVVCVHLRSANSSTRVFYIGRHPRTGICIAEFGGKYAREQVAAVLQEAFA
jgi:hypothetical protein